MRGPIQALSWEIWTAHRRGWLWVLAAIPGCALLNWLFARALQHSDALQSVSVLPLVFSLGAVADFFNFTETNRRKGYAGFPQRLFTLPVRTSVLVACPMTLAVISTLGVYLAWATLVLPMASVHFQLLWPAILLTVGVTLYQSLVWSLSGFRITRIVCLSIMFCGLFLVGLLPRFWAPPQEMAVQRILSCILFVLTVAAYLTSIWAIDRQRRGGGQGFAWYGVYEALIRVVPVRKARLSSPDAALFWMELRRAGIVLPATVLLAQVLILGPVMAITGHGRDATARAAVWSAICPLLLSVFVGIGFSKPDFWTLDLALPSFLAIRPITSGQILAAKLQVAAWSAALAWGVWLLVAVPVFALTCDTSALGDVWSQLSLVYSPASRLAILSAGLTTAAVLTWTLLVSWIWVGYSGRPTRFVGAMVGAALAILWATAVASWVFEQPDSDAIMVPLVPWFPWILACLVTAKAWAAAGLWSRAQRRGLITRRILWACLIAWAAATACLMMLVCALCPQVVWLRDLLLLVALLMAPLARIGAAPAAIADNRSR